MKASTPKASPKKKSDNARDHDDYHPVYRRLPAGRPLAKSIPLCHPRGKDGGWGH